MAEFGLGIRLLRPAGFATIPGMDAKKWKPFGRAFVRFVFGTTLGPAAVTVATGVAFLACVALHALPLVPALGAVAAVLLLSALVLDLLAFFKALAEGRFGRAMAQFALGLLGVPVFLVSLFVAEVAGRTLATGLPGGMGAAVTETSAEIPFSLSYKPAHPFLAEYDKAVVFPSGKTIGLVPDTGGGGPCALYALADGTFYLADGLGAAFLRQDYRVDVARETVDLCRAGRRFRVPDGTRSVVGWGADCIEVETATGRVAVAQSVPLGDELRTRRFLGVAEPSGHVETGGPDPLLADASFHAP